MDKQGVLFREIHLQRTVQLQFLCCYVMSALFLSVISSFIFGWFYAEAALDF